MEEILDIYDENMKFIGKATRKDAHKMGLWHKTFQCWIIRKEGKEEFILFQRRNKDKDTFPNLLGITAAGHLSSGEEPKDGVREIEEELGLKVNYEDLRFVGLFKQINNEESYKDHQFSYVYIYEFEEDLKKLKIQKEEVNAIIKLKVKAIRALFQKKVYSIIGEVVINADGEKVEYSSEFTLKDFVPHTEEYYLKLCQAVEAYYN